MLLDLVKCFEKVRLEHVWKWGCYWGVPRRLLRVILSVFSFQRRLIVDGSHSVPQQTITAIVAGSVFSCAVLHIVLIWPCDRLLALWPSISLAKYVDDIGLRMKGTQKDIRQQLPAATSCLINMLENTLDLPVSRGSKGKSVAYSSHLGLRYRLDDSLRKLGIRLVSGARNLGVDCYGAGRRTGQSVRVCSLAKLRSRARRLLHFKKNGGKVIKVAKCGVKPSMFYGARCFGLADSHVRALRRVSSACLPGSTL